MKCLSLEYNALQSVNLEVAFNRSDKADLIQCSFCFVS